VGVIGHELYAAGGANAGKALETLEIYDSNRRRWSAGPSMSTAREHLAATVAGERLYVLGGRAAGKGNFSIAERYVPVKRRWEPLPDLRKARGGSATATVGRRVAVFGGEEAGGTIAEVELYDPRLGRWTALPDLPSPRHGLGGSSRGRRIYAIEGGPAPGLSFSSVLETLGLRSARVARQSRR